MHINSFVTLSMSLTSSCFIVAFVLNVKYTQNLEKNSFSTFLIASVILWLIRLSSWLTLHINLLKNLSPCENSLPKVLQGHLKCYSFLDSMKFLSKHLQITVTKHILPAGHSILCSFPLGTVEKIFLSPHPFPHIFCGRSSSHPPAPRTSLSIICTICLLQLQPSFSALTGL